PRGARARRVALGVLKDGPALPHVLGEIVAGSLSVASQTRCSIRHRANNTLCSPTASPRRDAPARSPPTPPSGLARGSAASECTSSPHVSARLKYAWRRSGAVENQRPSSPLSE